MFQIILECSRLSKNVPNYSSSCQAPVDKVGFMKTHKTASSTIQNILLRFGMNSGWNFVFPTTGNHLGDPQHLTKLTQPFSRKWIKNVPWKSMTDKQGRM